MSVAMEERPRRNRITVDEYHRMAEVGLLAPDARVELVEGVIVDMPPMGIRHAAVIRRLTKLLEHAVGDRAVVSCQLPIRLGDTSEPQPDLALLAPPESVYGQRHPCAADTLLIVEVSDSSLQKDRKTKSALYAKHGIPQLWIVDAGGRRLHIFRSPSDETYSEIISPDSMDVVPIGSLRDATVDLSSLFA